MFTGEPLFRSPGIVMAEPGSTIQLPSGTQASLPLDAPPLPAGTPLLPARMVNEYVYCARLAYLEWVQGEWADSADTVEGRHRSEEHTSELQSR